MKRTYVVGLVLIGLGGVVCATGFASPAEAQQVAPVITGISPATAPSGTTPTINISGDGFAGFIDIALIDANGSAWWKSGHLLSQQQIQFTLPSYQPPGVYSVFVRQNGRDSNRIPFTVTATVPTPLPTQFPTPSPFPTLTPLPTFVPSPFPTPCLQILPPPSFFPFPSPCPTVSPGPTGQYVALGDSVAVGLWGFPPYPRRYEISAESVLGRQLNLINLAQSGATSDHLRSSLANDAQMRQAISQASIVSWNIGGNDLRAARDSYKRGTCGGADNQDCIRSAVARLKTNWTGIVAHLNNLRPQGALAIGMDIYNPYVLEDMRADSWTADGGLNDFQVFKIYFDDVNFFINHLISDPRSVSIAPVYAAFNGASGTEDPRAKGYISFDGFHPNTTGHAVIANQMISVTHGPLPFATGNIMRPSMMPYFTTLPSPEPSPTPSPTGPLFPLIPLDPNIHS